MADMAHDNTPHLSLPWWPMEEAPATGPDEPFLVLLVWVPIYGVHFGHVIEQDGHRLYYAHGLSGAGTEPTQWTWVPLPRDAWLMDPPERHGR